MKIEVRNLKFSAFASQETNCFEATLYVDGKRVGTARNAGHGGATYIEPSDCAVRLNTHAATLPKVVTTIKDEANVSGFFTYVPTGESIVDDLVTEALLERDLKKALSKRILFTVAGKVGIFQTKLLAPDVLARSLTEPDVLQRLNPDKILNLLPLAEAVVVYKAGTRT
ncbi:MAG: hypothetical protein ACMG6S_09780 [Byssovorax sp.]